MNVSPIVKTPLYGHTSPETAYLVPDYPYGFQLRCKKRFWLEKQPKKGFRFWGQTTNPKRGDVWNKPVASTYLRFGACMFLDEENHVQWTGISEYDSAEKVLEFLAKFPGADHSLLSDWAVSQIDYHKLRADQKLVRTMNKVVQPDSQLEIDENRSEAERWNQVLEELKKVRNG